MSEPLPDDAFPAPATALAHELVESGAAPVDVDVNELLAQITALQGRVTAMEAEKGVPSDPKAAALKNLQDHVKAHAAANPLTDFSELSDALAKVVEAGTVAFRDVELLRVLVEDTVIKHPSFAYLGELARNLAKAALV
jgi:hypothetical protein